MTCKMIRIHKCEEAKNQDKSSIYMDILMLILMRYFFFKFYDP